MQFSFSQKIVHIVLTRTLDLIRKCILRKMLQQKVSTLLFLENYITIFLDIENRTTTYYTLNFPITLLRNSGQEGTIQHIPIQKREEKKKSEAKTETSTLQIFSGFQIKLLKRENIKFNKLCNPTPMNYPAEVPWKLALYFFHTRKSVFTFSKVSSRVVYMCASVTVDYT